MADSADYDHIGGAFCNASLAAGLLPGEGQQLTPRELAALWRIFQAIGQVWENLHPTALDSTNLKSSWLDFIEAKTKSAPSYIAEYSNAVLCVDEVIQEYGEEEAFRRLFLDNGIPKGAPTTRLAHAKKYVIDEFIHVNIVASGFKSFGAPDNNGKNYKGYLGGSRYNLRARVRHYEPESEEAQSEETQ